MWKARARSRRAFTLIELLVVIAIISLLMALLLPAVQKVREAANKMRCGSNMSNIALGTHMYHDAIGGGKLPPAIEMNYANANKGNWNLLSDLTQPFGPNWAVHILPYIEQENLYAQANVGAYQALGSQQWRNIRGAELKLLKCPSDEGHEIVFVHVGGGWARGNYAANAGSGMWADTVQGGVTNQETNWGSGFWVNAKPVMGINYGGKLGTISNNDGTSNTIMYNEVRVGVRPNDPRGVWALGFPGSSVTVANAWGDADAPNDIWEGADDVHYCNEFWYPGIGSNDRMGCWTGCLSWQGQARSRHVNGVNAAFCDRSVRYVKNTIDVRAWAFILNPDDKYPFPSTVFE